MRESESSARLAAHGIEAIPEGWIAVEIVIIKATPNTIIVKIDKVK